MFSPTRSRCLWSDRQHNILLSPERVWIPPEIRSLAIQKAVIDFDRWTWKESTTIWGEKFVSRFPHLILSSSPGKGNWITAVLFSLSPPLDHMLPLLWNYHSGTASHKKCFFSFSAMKKEETENLLDEITLMSAAVEKEWVGEERERISCLSYQGREVGTGEKEWEVNKRRK